MIVHQVTRRLLNDGVISRDDLSAIPRDFMMKYCRLIIRPKEQIITLIEEILDYYKDRLFPVPGDPRRGRPEREAVLVTEATMNVWKTQCKPHVERGCLADPPGVNMYILRRPNDTQVRLDASCLPLSALPA
jgi:hypothetical protein